MIFPTNIGQKILTTSAIVAMTLPIAISNAKAQPLAITDKILIAQKLGEIERKIDLSEVPQTVLSAVKTASGGDPVNAQIQINPDGSVVYELGGQNQQGFDFEIEIKPNGEIIEIDEQIEASAVPEEVMKTFKYWLPNAQIQSTWRSTRYTSFNYYYEIGIENDFWIAIPADGSTLEVLP